MPGQIYSLKGQVGSFSPRFLVNLSPQCVRLGAVPFPGARVTGTHHHAGTEAQILVIVLQVWTESSAQR